MTTAAEQGPALPGVRLVRAPNPGPLTLEGTNTWLVGRRRVLVVDPGPAHEAHLARVLATAGEAGGVLSGVLLTHGHPDHTEALDAPQWRRATAGLPVLAGSSSLGDPVTAEALAAVCDLPAEVLATPGHTADSLSLLLPRQRVVLTGDTVLGRGPSVVAHPDGHLGDYLDSLTRLAVLCAAGRWRGLPGHGPVITDLAGAVAALLEHRRERLDQVRKALLRLEAHPDPAAAETVRAVVATVYPGLDPEVEPVLVAAAESTTRAAVAYLAARAER